MAFLILTTRCNRHCAYCFYETAHQSRGDTSRVLPVEKPLLRGLKGAGIDRLILTGGEPLLLPGLEGKVRLASEWGFDTLLLTNGDGLDAARLEGLHQAGLRSISISLDHITEGSDAKAPWKILDLLKEYGRMNTAVITPITRKNLDQLPEILGRIAGLGIYHLLQPVFVPEEHPLHRSHSLGACTKEEIDRFERILDQWESVYGRGGYGDLIREFYTGSGDAAPPFCGMGTHALVIDPGGDVFPCFHRRDLCAGNILTGDPEAVLRKASESGRTLRTAPCFGEHCISLFSHLG